MAFRADNCWSRWGPQRATLKRPWSTQRKGARSAGEKRRNVTEGLTSGRACILSRAFLGGKKHVCLLSPSCTKKRKEGSRTTTFTSCVRSSPYPFWELVVTQSYRSYNVFNSQSTLTFSKHGLLQRALVSWLDTRMKFIVFLLLLFWHFYILFPA